MSKQNEQPYAASDARRQALREFARSAAQNACEAATHAVRLASEAAARRRGS